MQQVSDVSRFQAECEDAARHLIDVYQLSSAFEPCLLISPHDQAFRQVRGRLAAAVERLERWPPDAGLAARLHGLAAELRDSRQRPVIWLQQQQFDPEPWRFALASLNQQRELYRAEAPWMWVLAGPPELVPLVHEYAMHVLTGTAVRLHVLAEPTRPVRWLHLSDFHFRYGERWERRATLQALLRHAAGLRERNLAPDLVLITGDVAASGQRREYQQAELFLVQLAATLELEPAAHFFLVPGNHDVDRGAIGSFDDLILRGLTTQDDIDQLFADPRAMGLLSRRLDEFYAFTERLLGPARGLRPERPWRIDLREVHGVRVAILQLNSAWAAGHDADRGKLLVGEAQVREALAEAGDGFLRIALMHHPVADLADVDRGRLETLLGAPDGIHFLLRGHLHRIRSLAVRTPPGFVAELAAGAAHDEGTYPQTHLLTEFDPAAGAARVRFFRYSSRGQGFWAPDTLAFEHAHDGVWSFELPAELRLPDRQPSIMPMNEARRANITSRYRAAAAAVHGAVRFVGFADHRPRPNVGVPELFVPLRFEERRGHGEEEKKYWTTQDFFLRIFRRDDEEATRIVVLGDPGSGKTTLCRLATVVIAGEAPVDGVDVGEELLPLFLPFRDYVRVCREKQECSLVDFLAEQASSQLQVATSEEFLEKVLEKGHAVLLLDGLDEVGSAADREGMRERVQAFCRLYPNVPALVTSRIAGYNDAPLPAIGSDGFVHLVLTPFTGEDVRRFVSHWYAVQEPTDPQARDRGIADLMAALDADPRVRELARNPMLATLIALVHRYEAHLPGERAALNEICVKTLLETWPEARRTTFREVDARLQRTYLEALAYRMQKSRARGDREVIIERQALIDTLVAIVDEREGSGATPEKIRRSVERWVWFLAEGSGLLVEYRPGVFSFINLSFLEYLAACGLEHSADASEEIIAEKYGDPAWREVCLLAMGRRATDKVFNDRLFRRISEQYERTDHWSFLLHGLREEVAFDAEQRAAIVRGAAQCLLDRRRHEWQPDQRALDELMRLSVRHAEWAGSWVRREITTARGRELAAVVAIRLHRDEELLRVLGERPDAAVAAADLLDFWPATQVGRWAASVIAAEAALEWLLNDAARELLPLRSLAALAPDGEHLAAGHLVALVRTAAAWTADARGWIKLLANRPRPGGRGLPIAVTIEPQSLRIGVAPQWPETSTASPGLRTPFFDRDFAVAFAADFAAAFAVDFSRFQTDDFARFLALNFARNFAIDPARRFARYLGKALRGEFARYFDRGFTAEMVTDFARAFAMDSVRGSTIDFPEHTGEMADRRHLGPDRERARYPVLRPPVARPGPESGELTLLRQVLVSQEKADVERWVAAAVARLAGEAWVALATAAEQGDEQRAAYAQVRVRNAWLLQVWPAVDDRLAGQPSPDALALYLGLGWTQATTTWQWPATERWIAILGGEPPVEWLPRSQWHLCWLLHDPADDAHREALNEALDEGLGDKAHPGVAELTRACFGRDDPTRSE